MAGTDGHSTQWSGEEGGWEAIGERRGGGRQGNREVEDVLLIDEQVARVLLQIAITAQSIISQEGITLLSHDTEATR